MFNHPSERLFGFTEEMKRKNVTTSSRILEKTVLKPPECVQEVLKTDTVYRLKRLRFVGEKPIAIEDAYHPFDKFPNLFENFTDKSSLYKMLKRKFGIVPYYATETIEAFLPTGEEAKLLQIPESKPILGIERRTFIKSGELIKFVRAIYRTDIYRITLNLRRV